MPTRLPIFRISFFVSFLLLSFGVGEAFEVDGVIEPYRLIKIGGSGTPGILEDVVVDRGDLVKKGQMLGTLQSGVEKAALEISRARAELEADLKIEEAKAFLNLALARAELEAVIKARRADLDLAIRKENRSEELYKKAFVPFAEKDEAESRRMLADAMLEEAVQNKRFAELEHKRAEAQLKESLVSKRLAELEHQRAAEVVKRLIIRSPIDGVVVERYLSGGEYVETESILKLAQIHPLNVEVILPVKLYPAIKVGMVAKVTPEAPMAKQYPAKVKIVDRVIDAASGTFVVRLELPNQNHQVPAG